MEATITPKDRLSFTLFLALAIHAALILGLGFVWTAKTLSSPTIEVTLAQHSDAEAPEQADFIAQSDQLGSGDAEDVRDDSEGLGGEHLAKSFDDLQGGFGNISDLFSTLFDNIGKKEPPGTKATLRARQRFSSALASACSGRSPSASRPIVKSSG